MNSSPPRSMRSLLPPAGPPRHDVPRVLAVLAALIPGASAHAQTAVVEMANGGDTTLLQLFDDGTLLGVGATAGGTGTLPPAAEGPGTRLLWYPAEGAFRAGEATGTQWNAANIGAHSVAFGLDNTASGDESVAIGSRATASGRNSMAIGLPWGGIDPLYNPGATASGAGSFALGHGTVASGDTAIAIGTTSINTNGAIASGYGSIAIGSYRVVAGASHSLALGNEVTANGEYSMAIGHEASAGGHQGALVFGTGLGTITAEGDYQFAADARHFWFGTDEQALVYDTSHLIDTDTGAYLTDGGIWTNSSDANKKENYRAVEGEALLEKLAGIPVRTWNYKTARDSVRHMGPTAQDFHAAFELGDSDRTIATGDIAGVNMRAVQALEVRTRALQERNEALEARIAELESAQRQQGGPQARLDGYGTATLCALALVAVVAWRRRADA